MAATNIHDAKTHFSRLLAKVAAGGTVVIAKAGKPVAKLVPVDSPDRAPRRFGFLAGEITVPDDFDTIGTGHIEALFEGRP